MVIKEGYKQTDVGVIPQDWEVKSIEELTPQNKKNGIVDGPFGSNLKTIHYRKSGIPIITSGYVTNGYFYANDYLYVELEKFKQEKRSSVKGGDIVMAKIGERCGASAILPLNHQIGILSGNALKISIDENKYPTSLIWQILYNLYLTGKLEILRTTGAQPALSMANLKKFQIALPLSLGEKTSIATALSDTDGLITGLEKLITKKRNIKQSAMQQLLKPKEGWEVKTLGECLLKNPDYGINAAAVEYNDNLPTYLRITDISENGKYLTSNKASVDHNLSSSYYLEEGDIVFARTGASVGKTYLYNKNDGMLVFAGFLIRLKANPEMLDCNYLFFLTQTNSYWDWVKANSMRSGQPGLNSNEYKSFQIPFPPKDEQTHIATILLDMDAELTALEQKLEKYKKVKLGMMQELLTGKKRLV